MHRKNRDRVEKYVSVALLQIIKIQIEFHRLVKCSLLLRISQLEEDISKDRFVWDKLEHDELLCTEEDREDGSCLVYEHQVYRCTGFSCSTSRTKISNILEVKIKHKENKKKKQQQKSRL